jgi:multiple sugar transport system ATP-binding protein
VSGGTARASSFSLELPKAPGIEQGVIGLRPEDLTEVPHEGFPKIYMKVEVVEVLGSDQFLYGKVGGDEVIARLDPQFKVVAGDKVRLHVNMRRLHLFDVKTERAVL